MAMAGKKALVTGGAGFIGSHLCGVLIDRGWNVSVVDDLSSSDGSNIEGLGDRVSLHVGDIRDLDLMKGLLEDSDALFNLAAMVSVPKSVQKPRECYEVNVTAFSDMLELLKDRPVPVVYASSAAIYGEGADDGPRRETELPMPQSPYGASKAMDELVAAAAFRCWGIPSVGLRFFNVYGPRQNPEGPYASVIPRFTTALLDGRAVTVFGDGEQTRDFVHVEDVARVMVKAADEAQSIGGSVMNVGSGRRASVNEVYSLLSRLVSEKESPSFEPERPGDIRHSFADLSELRSLMDLSSFRSLEDGIDDTVSYYRRRCGL
ncbi:NAD-dependent epimerase/dehydratase [Dethiosulfovibrio peptidovorans DSM 11002]|uniref:NAD-dependent epimerase/dehydratase n=2 Tax=Dethiosulfovibrio TaxID=47054 RepID=D2Z5I4_9BACT|nr:NAD-dependent epimerase/dehydratase [Dethiosulfovibrio peptidovorans DSM 11002]